MRAGDHIHVTIDGRSDEGLGTASLEGRAMIVEDALPGESGDVILTHVGERLYGRMLSRDAAGPGRRAALPCPRWTAQSPCRVMHLDDQAQADFKRGRVTSALAWAGLDASKVGPLVRSPAPLGYRAKAVYVVARTRAGALVLGAYRRNSHAVQDMAGCPLEESPITRVAAALREALSEVAVADTGLPVVNDGGCGSPLVLDARALRPAPIPRHPRLVPEGLRYVVLRAAASGEVAAALLSPSGRLANAEAIFAAARARAPELCAIHLGSSGHGDAIFGKPPLIPLPGSRPLLERFGDLDFEISPRSFFQVNRGAADLLHTLAAERAHGPLIVDVYSGVGALSLRLARNAQVIGIESVPEATADAQHNAARNALYPSTDFRTADAAAGLAALAAENLHPDTIILNPPRKGCDPAVLTAAAALHPTRILYISCNPLTLARDLSKLAPLGFTLSEAIPVDLFPQTEHVECVGTVFGSQ